MLFMLRSTPDSTLQSGINTQQQLTLICCSLLWCRSLCTSNLKRHQGLVELRLRICLPCIKNECHPRFSDFFPTYRDKTANSCKTVTTTKQTRPHRTSSMSVNVQLVCFNLMMDHLVYWFISWVIHWFTGIWILQLTWWSSESTAASGRAPGLLQLISILGGLHRAQLLPCLSCLCRLEGLEREKIREHLICCYLFFHPPSALLPPNRHPPFP